MRHGSCWQTFYLQEASIAEVEASMMLISIFILKYRLPAQNATMHSTSLSIQAGTLSPFHCHAALPVCPIQDISISGRNSGASNILKPLSHHPETLISRTRPTTSNIHPFRQTRSLFPFHVHNIRVTSTSAANSILLHWIPRIPVLVFFFPFLLI